MLTAPVRTIPRPEPRPERPGDRPAPIPDRRPGDAASTGALAVLTLASAAGLFRVFGGFSWIWAVVATVLVTHGALWGMRRSRIPPVLAAPASLGVVALMVVWTVFGSSTYFGFPGGPTWRHVSAAIRGLGPGFASSLAPVAPTPGFVMLAAAGGGVVAVLSDWTAFRWRSPMLAVVPALATFIACCVPSAGPGRAAVVGAFVAAACAFVLVYRTSSSADQIWFAGVRAGVDRWWIRVGGIAAGVAVIVAALLTSSISRPDGRGALGWRSGLGAGPGARVVPNPIVSMQARLLQLSDTPVFSVQSTVPSYWRLTSLDQFNGDTWTSTGSYKGFTTKLPGVAAVPPGTRTVTETFQIQALDSVWLPDAFNPLTVTGVHNVSYDPSSNSLLTSTATSDGLLYTVTSYQYLSTLNSQELEAAPPLATLPGAASYIQQYRELPASVYGPITELANRIVAHQTTEYGKAMAIQDYLRSPPFSYSLHPRLDGSSQNALYDFLFTTRQGYCQQFAGAYAVLARAAGLPTRLAVGFDTGTPKAGGGYQVEDRDAHTWPEVWFGPQYGWLPFEPTPSFSEPDTTGYATPTSPNGSLATTPTTLPSGASNTVAPLPKGKTAAPTSVASAATPATSHPGSSGWAAPLLAALVGAGALWVALNLGGQAVWRRRRRRRSAQSGEAGLVLDAWDALMADLVWRGVARSPTETNDEFAGRAEAVLDGQGAPQTWDHGGVKRLAGLANRAAYSPGVPDFAAAEAESAGAEVHRWLIKSSSRRERLARVFLPPRPAGREGAGQLSSLLPNLRRSRRATSSTA